MNRQYLITFAAGPPYVRAIGPIKAAAGNHLILRCPYSGYPIEAILWEKSREEILPGNASFKQQSCYMMSNNCVSCRISNQ